MSRRRPVVSELVGPFTEVEIHLTAQTGERIVVQIEGTVEAFSTEEECEEPNDIHRSVRTIPPLIGPIFFSLHRRHLDGDLSYTITVTGVTS